MFVKKSGAPRIRRLRRADIPACERIVAQSEPWKTLGLGVDFEALLAHQRLSLEAHVCASGKDVLGFVVFTPYPVFARGGYLRAIAVHPQLRERGIGRKLLSLAEKKTSSFSRNLYLCVSSFNRKAKAFYVKRGYERVGCIPGLVIPRASELIYRKRLRMPKQG